MSTHVVGFKPPDFRWKQMKSVWDACNAAGIDPPDSVLEYFEHRPPDEAGVEVRLETGWSSKTFEKIEAHPCLKLWQAEGRSGFEIDVTKLPDDVTIIRFYNSW